MRKPAHGHALGRRGVGSQGVDLHVETKGVGFVAEILFGIRSHGREVPAGKAVIGGRHGVPALADRLGRTGSRRGSGHTIALARSQLFRCQGLTFAGGLEVIGPIFFAAQIRAPRRFAMAAVVECAASHGPGRVPAGHHQTANLLDRSAGAADTHRRLCGDTAVQGRI